MSSKDGTIIAHHVLHQFSSTNRIVSQKRAKRKVSEIWRRPDSVFITIRYDCRRVWADGRGFRSETPLEFGFKGTYLDHKAAKFVRFAPTYYGQMTTQSPLPLGEDSILTIKRPTLDVWPQ